MQNDSKVLLYSVKDISERKIDDIGVEISDEKIEIYAKMYNEALEKSSILMYLTPKVYVFYSKEIRI